MSERRTIGASVFLAACLALLGTSPAVLAGTTVSADVDLRVAPTVSLETDPPRPFVVPSEHWSTKDVECWTTSGLVCFDDLNTTTEAQWLIDPIQTTQFNDETGVAGCSFTATDDNDDGVVVGKEVLDQAASNGCITGWDYTDDCGGGFLVTMVDGLRKSSETCTGYPTGWWQIQKNAHIAGDGIASLAIEDEDSLSLVFMRQA